MGQGWRGLGGGCGAWGKGRTGGGEPQGELGFLSTQDKGAGRRDFKGLAVGVRGVLRVAGVWSRQWVLVAAGCGGLATTLQLAGFRWLRGEF